MSLGYVLTTAAEADLREIIRYTRKQWVNAQARQYLVQLRHCIEQLAAERGRIKDMSQLHPGAADATRRASLHLLSVP